MKNERMKRVISLLLAAVLVLSWFPGGLPVTAADADAIQAVADTSTMNSYTQFFAEDSSDHAGMVWTDKSVFTDEAGSGLPGSITIADKPENFLVALSVMASNKTISGYDTIPTDTVFILDLSSSMRTNDDRGDSAINELVNETNAAIKRIMALNKHNRIGVVLYAGNVNGNWNTIDKGMTQVLLPLDSYTTTSDGYLRSAYRGNNADERVEVADGVKNGDGRPVTGGMDTATGTFMQDGIYEALQQFLSVEPTVEGDDGTIQAGVSRLPIMVLMSDGEPTMGTNLFAGDSTTETTNGIPTSLGDGILRFNDGNFREQNMRYAIAFVTQLTASFAKNKVAEHYDNTPLFYTLTYGEEATNKEEARSVMDPASTCQTLRTMWQTMQNDGTVRIVSSNNGRTSYYAYENAYVDDSDDLYYVDKFFPANRDADFSAAFQSLVDEIVLQSQYSPTLVDSSNHNLDGYVSFVDHIGEHMEVAGVKGMVIGNTVFTGAALARAFTPEFDSEGNLTNADELDDEWIDSVQVRLGIADTATARNLLRRAYEHGQMRYTSDTEFSNYIGWYSDANGNYVGFWYEGTEEAAPSNAVHINKSYAFFGPVDEEHGVKPSDMVYASIRVRTEISTGDATIAWAIPSALIPTVTYSITLDGNTYDSEMLRFEKTGATAPLRLVFEVALRSDLSQYNLDEMIGRDDEHYDAETGRYTFYTNDWTSDVSNNINTYVYFEASEENERYYYTEDTVIYVDNQGRTKYSGNTAPDPDGVYYRPVYYYTRNGGTQIRYERISAESLAVAEKSGSDWIIPKGAYYQLLNTRIRQKAGNETDTLNYVVYPVVDTHDDAQYHTAALMGNNGKLTVEPKPMKTVAVNDSGANDDGRAVMVGDELTYTIEARNNHETAASITITDSIPAGTDYVEGSATNGGVYDEATGRITWTVQNVAAGETVTVSFKVTVTEEALQYNAVENTATIQVGNDPSFESNTTSNPPEGKSASDENNAPIGSVAVGEHIVYHIYYHNDTGADATCTITDIIPAGTRYVDGTATVGGVYDEDTNTLTWTLSVPADSRGSVSFKVVVDASAVTQVENYATIQIGDNDPSYDTNHNVTQLKYGNLSVTKKIAAGDNAGNQEFEMTLVESTKTLNGTFDGVQFTNGVATVKLTAGQTVTIENLPAGLYFTVTETDYSGTGWTASYAPQAGTITENGTLALVVTNDYEAAPVKYQLKGNKTFVGDNFPHAVFTFAVQEVTVDSNLNPTAVQGGLRVAATTETGTSAFSFSERIFSAPLDAYYLISEESSAVAGVTTDSTQYLLHLVVADNGQGKMVLTQQMWKRADASSAWTEIADFDAAADTVSFTNTYAPLETRLTIDGSKVLTGRKLQANEFSFELIHNGVSLGYAANDADGNFAFAEITYTEAGSYTYYIRENNTGAANMAYDDTYYEVDVTVTDIGGQLKAQITKILKFTKDDNDQYPSTGTEVDEIIYSNVYSVQDTSVTLQGTKFLTGAGADGLSAGEFSFAVYKSDANGTKGDMISSGTNMAGTSSAAITFASIGFTVKDMSGAAVKDFYFLVEEDIPISDGPTFNPNMFYDQTQYLVKVTVTHDRDAGTLTAGDPVYTVIGGNTADAADFTNIQNPDSVAIAPTADKITVGSYLPENLSFSFRVVDMEGNTDATGIGQANGAVTFTNLVFTDEMLGDNQSKTFSYWIEESNAGTIGNGVTYDTTRYLYVVTLSRDDTNALQVSDAYYGLKENGDRDTAADYTEKVDTVVFKNEYNAETFINLTAEKTLEGRDLEANEFDFRLQRLDADGKPVENSAVNGNNDADGDVTFATLNFSTEMLAGIQKQQDGSWQLQYLMSEIEPAENAIPGVTYDDAMFIVTIRITQEAQGGLKAELVGTAEAIADGNGGYQAGDDAEASFTNTYVPSSGAEVTIEADKKLTGRTLAAGEFGFALYRYAGNDSWISVGTAFNDANGKVSFTRVYNASTLSQYAFDQNDQYTVLYRIDEINNNLGGITYDRDSIYVKVVVTHDEQNASYTAEVVGYYSDAACTTQTKAEFQNSYATGETSYIPVADKVLLDGNGQRIESGYNFGFEVVAVEADGTVMTEQTESGKEYVRVMASGTVDGSGAVDFTAIHFTAGCGSHDDADADGNHYHYFLIREVPGTDVGITYSGEEIYLKVKINDDGKGNLTVQDAVYYSDAFETEISGTAAITNHYGPGYLELELELNKSFKTASGRDYHYKMSGSEFDFEVTDENGKHVTYGTNGADVNGVAPINFGSITINKSDLTEDADNDNKADKTFTFYITEVDSAIDYIQEDQNTIKVEVFVEDDGYGNLTADYTYTVNGTQTEATGFVNVYQPDGTYLVLDVAKTLEGKNLADGEFTFVLTGNGTELTAANDANGHAAFRLDFTAADMSGGKRNADGTYSKQLTYTLTESAGAVETEFGTYTYDERVYTLTVTLTDNGSGKLSAAYTVTNQAGETITDGVTFANSYTRKPVEVVLEGDKQIVDAGGAVLNGHDLSGYEFTVKDATGTQVTTGTSDADGKITFTGFQLNTVGVHSFYITENASGVAGITDDASIWQVDVAVSYNADSGELSYTTTAFKVGSTQTESIVFANIYEAAPVSVTLSGNKKLTGRDLKAGEFSFTLTDEAGNETYASNNAEGAYSFVLDYTFTDLEGADSKDFVYRIAEVSGDLGGVNYDEKVYTVTVRVTDDAENGQLTAEVVGGSTGGYDFTNTYTPDSVSVMLQAIKVLEGRDLKEGEFTFTLTDADGNVTTASNAADGAVEFPDIEYTEAGTYTYTIAEVKGALSGVTYDETIHTVTVEITDDGMGSLKSTVNYGEADGLLPVFTNAYQAKEADITIQVTKKLTGRQMKDGEFKFVLVDSQGNLVAEATNDAEGNVLLELTYEEAGQYNYTFSVREVDNGLDGVIYDDAQYGVQITVTDNEEGALEHTVVFTDSNGEPVEKIEFENTYQADAVRLELEALKTLTGRELEAGEFEFVLTDEAGSEITAYNEEDGTINFEITYTEAGTYTYTMTETDNGAEGITYSTDAYTVVVVVADDGTGKLQVQQVSVDGTDVRVDNNAADTGIVFENEYDEPDEPPRRPPHKPHRDPEPDPKPEPPKEPDSPDTGDYSPVVFFAVLTLSSGLALIALLVYFKKRWC